MLIGLTYDLRSDYAKLGYSEAEIAEFDSDETICAIDQTIKSLGYKTCRIGNVFSLCEKLVAGQRWDLVFNIAEGLKGRCRESQVPAILEAYGIGYTLSDPLICALTLDKAMTKRILQTAGLATPKFAVVESTQDIKGVSLQYPLFAKPIAEGTGKGIDANSKVKSSKELKEICEKLLKQFSQPVLVEEYLPGREFTAAVLGNGAEAHLLGIMEVKMRQPDEDRIYSYDAKERCEQLIDYVPYNAGELFEPMEQLAVESYKVLQCKDAGRVDIRCDAERRPCFIEINPLPGLHPTHSDLPMIATQQGMSYKELIASIINNALRRLG